MWGSIPLALEVTSSGGTGPVASGFSFFTATTAAATASISFFEVGASPRFLYVVVVPGMNRYCE